MANTVLDRIRKLDEEKAKLLSEAKQQALAKANEALEELSELGFDYRLVEGKGSQGPRLVSPSGRRTGIREEVLKTVQDAGPDGISSSAVREKLSLTDKTGSQAVANALSALKRANKLTQAQDGNYVAA